MTAILTQVVIFNQLHSFTTSNECNCFISISLSICTLWVVSQIDYYEDDGEIGSCAEGIGVSY